MTPPGLSASVPPPTTGSSAGPRPRTWSASTRTITAQLAAGTAAVAGAAATDPALGRLLAAVAAVLLLGGGLRDLVVRPVVAADTAGLRVVDGLGRRRIPWAAVRIGVDGATRRGIRSEALELDLGEHLVLVPSRRLGAPAATVAAELARLRPAHPSGD